MKHKGFFKPQKPSQKISEGGGSLFVVWLMTPMAYKMLEITFQNSDVGFRQDTLLKTLIIFIIFFADVWLRCAAFSKKTILASLSHVV